MTFPRELQGRSKLHRTISDLPCEAGSECDTIWASLLCAFGYFCAHVEHLGVLCRRLSQGCSPGGALPAAPREEEARSPPPWHEQRELFLSDLVSRTPPLPRSIPCECLLEH